MWVSISDLSGQDRNEIIHYPLNPQTLHWHLSRRSSNIRISSMTHCWLVPLLTCITTLTDTVKGQHRHLSYYQRCSGATTATGRRQTQTRFVRSSRLWNFTAHITPKQTKKKSENEWLKIRDLQLRGSKVTITSAVSQVSPSVGWLCGCWKVSSATCYGQYH